MSWLFSQALVEEYLGDISSDGEQSVQSNGNRIQQAYCAPDKMTAFSRLSRFGMTYKPLTEGRGEGLLTSYLAGFHAKTSQPQEKAQELTESDQECGHTWQGSFTKYDQNTSSWKTHQCSLLGDLDEFSETWPRWGLMRDGACWEQPMSERRTSAIESGLPDGDTFFHTPNCTGLDGGSHSRKALKKRQETWPTPLASDWKPRGPNSKQQGLQEIVKKRMWPTPATKGYGHASEGMVSNLISKIEDGMITKEEAEAMLSLPKLENHRTWKKKFPTPTAHNAKETNAPSESERNTPTLAASVGGKLNPTWVEWLMGWPLEWTDLKPLETDKFQRWLEQHGKS
jgi:DNA (cytosine-5)-methyltransferase 1